MSPFLFQEKLEELLETSLDFGITEKDFWEMSLAEINRVLESKHRTALMRIKENAKRDYILADLIGLSVSRLFSKQNDYPKIYEVYPNLFKNEDIDNKKDELSAIRFRQFAEHFNRRWQEKNE